MNSYHCPRIFSCYNVKKLPVPLTSLVAFLCDGNQANRRRKNILLVLLKETFTENGLFSTNLF
jgi:hypothetical protein